VPAKFVFTNKRCGGRARVASANWMMMALAPIGTKATQAGCARQSSN